MTLKLPEKGIDNALEALGDRSLTIEDRVGVYAVLHQVQLRINRALRKVKDEIVVHMVQSDTEALGPVSLKRTAIGVKWPVNDEGNWGDYGVQDELATYAKIARDYIRHVPEHYEIRTAELGAGVASGDPVAVRLHRECKAKGWRTEEARNVTLNVKEAA